MNSEKVFPNALSSKLRACLNCSILKPMSYYKQYGCPNCPFLQANKAKNLHSVTSQTFKGVIGVIDPKRSWIAKWQRINTYVPGIYAMTVEGNLSDEFIERIEKEGRVYIDRTDSFGLN